uniref:Uncharacterized protein n=1 Tax=Mammaliicoccus phage MSShimriz1 TaxID=3230127 RepID=A0AAU8GSQ5_9VIRU
MNKNKVHNTLVEIWRQKDDETKCKNVQVNHSTTIRELLSPNEVNNCETLAIYKLTKKGKLKLIYSKEDTQ